MKSFSANQGSEGHRRARAFAVFVSALVAGSVYAAQARDESVSSDQQQSATRAKADFAPQDPPGEWRRAARDYANTRYSPLDQITVDNVHRLRMSWTFSDGEKGGHEAAPLVVNNTMYLVAPFPNEAYALDLTQPGAPIKWAFTPNPAPMAQGKACCDVVNRGAALSPPE